MVNVQVEIHGDLRVAVVDEDTAEEIEGFATNQSVPIEQDATRIAVRWKHHDSLGPLKERYIRLVF